jgi:hypothetical protein
MQKFAQSSPVFIDVFTNQRWNERTGLLTWEFNGEFRVVWEGGLGKNCSNDLF